jgi:hypothetical protein
LFGEYADGVAVDSSENAYIAGITTSTDFPTTNTNAFQPNTAPPAAVSNGTGFVARIDTSTTKAPTESLVYSTYLGGENQDLVAAVTLKPNSAVAYVTGTTRSLLFPTFPSAPPGPYQTTGSAGGCAFVSLIDTGQIGNASLTYSTFLGGALTTGFGIAADAAGNAYVVGGTNNFASFPVTPGAFQPAFAPGAPGEGFISEFNPGGNGAADLVYSSFFGGGGSANGPDSVNAIALDNLNNAYLTGETFSSSATFPVYPPTALQTSLNGLSDAFIAKLTLIPTLDVSPTSLNFDIQPVGVTSGQKMVTLTNNTSDAIPFPGTSVSFSGSNAADFGSPSNTCGASIAAGASCTVSATFTPSVASAESATLVITVVITDGGLSSSQSFDVSLSGTGSATAPAVGLTPTSLPFGGQMLTTTSAAIPVKLTNTGLGPLTINSIAASGDFAATSTGATACPIGPATLPAGGNCTINVTFAPTVVGARTGTLTVTDNANGSPQTVPLTGTGWDFQVTATSPQTGASPLIFNATMTPLGGFNQSVAFTCTGAPTGSTCTIATPITAADGKTPQSVQVTLTRTSSALPVPTPPARTPPISMPQIVPLILALLLLFLLPKTKGLRVRLGLATAVVLLMALAGCGGPSKPKTITGNLTITGTSSGTAGTVSHSAAPVAVTLN